MFCVKAVVPEASWNALQVFVLAHWSPFEVASCVEAELLRK